MATCSDKMGIRTSWDAENKNILDEKGNVIEEIPMDIPEEALV